ncbi:MAG: hypothetical protein ABIJ57_12325 [Pseudomonadota bacterium]
MEIKIKKCGYKFGTVGWLAAGIADGSIKISEGTSKASGKHGLWLKWEKVGNAAGTDEKNHQQSVVLAIFNPYDLSLSDYADAHRYEVAPREGDVWCLGDEIGCTDACWETITEIAQAWVEHVTTEREKDKKVKITIKFEEAA